MNIHEIKHSCGATGPDPGGPGGHPPSPLPPTHTHTHSTAIIRGYVDFIQAWRIEKHESGNSCGGGGGGDARGPWGKLHFI